MGGVRKAVKTELLLKKQIRFTQHRVGEEAIYSFLLMHYADSFSFIKGSVYEYVNRIGSQSDTKDDDPWGGVAKEMKERVMRMGLYEQYANTINAVIATAAIVSLDKIARNYDASIYREKARERINRYQIEIDRCYPIDIKHMPIKAIMLYPFMKIGWNEPIRFASCLNRARR